jgi:hypothetical protein
MPLLRDSLFACVCVAPLAGALFPQNTVTGVVRDPAGAVIQNCAVTLDVDGGRFTSRTASHWRAIVTRAKKKPA